MGKLCSACGADNAGTARFCNQCGSSLAAAPTPALERQLLEVLLDWALLHYYTCEFREIHALGTHADTVDRVGDDRLRTRWLAWLGLAEYMLVPDFPRALGLLDEAIAVGRRAGDVTATGYALAWKEWVLWQGGGAAEVPQVWAQLAALLPEVTDVHDRRYMTLKGLGGAALPESPWYLEAAAALSNDVGT